MSILLALVRQRARATSFLLATIIYERANEVDECTYDYYYDNNYLQHRLMVIIWSEKGNCELFYCSSITPVGCFLGSG